MKHASVPPPPPPSQNSEALLAEREASLASLAGRVLREESRTSALWLDSEASDKRTLMHILCRVVLSGFGPQKKTPASDTGCSAAIEAKMRSQFGRP